VIVRDGTTIDVQVGDDGDQGHVVVFSPGKKTPRTASAMGRETLAFAC